MKKVKNKYKNNNRHKFLLKYHIIFSVKYRKRLLIQLGDDIKRILLDISDKYDFNMVNIYGDFMHDYFTTIYENIRDIDPIIYGMTEGVTRDGEYRLNRLITMEGEATAAHRLVDHFISRLSGGKSVKQLGHSNEYDTGILEVISYLKLREYNDAVKTAKDTADAIVSGETASSVY